MVEPGHSFQRRQFDGLTRFPGSAAVDQFSLVEPVDRLGQGIIVTVAFASHRRLNAGFSQALAVLYRHVLRAPVAMVDQLIPFGLPCVSSGCKLIQAAIEN